ncbi:very short patch repair endonuclease [Bowmanella dokdonensis]|nr:very short patch repair endonuclease [Bowmanella dokdonensis]
MQAVKQKNTKPEVLVRKLLHSLGYRFRIHKKGLPGTPDIVLPKYKTCIFVHGCFWHHHKDCKRSPLPKTNTSFWENKIMRNVARDKKHIEDLQRLGWKVLVIWECETKSAKAIQSKFLEVFKS